MIDVTELNGDCGCGQNGFNKMVDMLEDQRRPFTEEFLDKNTVIRHFDPTADDHLFKWHQDPQERIIEVINENNWKFQFDNKIPQKLEINKIIKIKKGEYHRLIKGTTPLSLKIKF
jgi:hypothetical protein